MCVLSKMSTHPQLTVTVRTSLTAAGLNILSGHNSVKLAAARPAPPQPATVQLYALQTLTVILLHLLRCVVRWHELKITVLNIHHLHAKYFELHS